MISKEFVLNVFIIFIVPWIIFYRAIYSPFLHDDLWAITGNLDVQEKVPWSNIWFNDFWGKRIILPESHKSYRPIVIMLFRFLHSVWGDSPIPYHVLNIFFHSVASVLFFLVCRRIIFDSSHKQAPFLAGILFATHPVHTEAVCGVVGCADLLSGIFFMTSLLVFFPSFHEKEENISSHCKKSEILQTQVVNEEENKTNQNQKTSSTENSDLRKRLNNPNKDQNVNEKSKEERKKSSDSDPFPYLSVLLSFILAAIGMLCKESGLTVLPLLVVFEIMRKFKKSSRIIETLDENFLTLIVLAFLWIFITSWLRLWIMDWSTPTFTPLDNPAAFATSKLTRCLHYLYLCWYNFRLLLLPINLCYDYSHGSIPLITSIWDSRNIYTFSFLIGLAGSGMAACFSYLKNKSNSAQTFLMGCFLMIVPFLPASNLFVTVGFVVAERVLYLPSTGFIIIVVFVWCQGMEGRQKVKNYSCVFMAGLVVFYMYQSHFASLAWTSEENLSKAGISAFPNNAKGLYNYGNVLRDVGKWKEAIESYEKSLQHWPTHSGCMVNLANAVMRYNKSFSLTESLYKRAIKVDPRTEVNYLSLAVLYHNLNRPHDALKVLTEAKETVYGEMHKLVMLARMYHSRIRSEETQRIYLGLVKRSCLWPKNHVLMENCYNDYVEVLKDFINSTATVGKHDEEISLLRHCIELINSRDQDFLKKAISILISSNSEVEIATALTGIRFYSDLKKETNFAIPKPTTKQGECYNKEDSNKSPTSSNIEQIWNSAVEHFQNRRYSESKSFYEVYIKAKPDNLEALGQYAALLFEIGDLKKGEDILVKITKHDENCQNTGVWHNLGSFYGKQNKFSEAISLFQSCLNRRKMNLNSESDDRKGILLCQLSKHQWNRGNQLIQNGEKNSGDSLIKKSYKNLILSLELDPDNQEAINFMQQFKAWLSSTKFKL